MIDKAAGQDLELHDFEAAMISKEKLKQQFKQIMSLDSHPGHISAGFAVGVFISFTPPIPGLHTALALIIALVFRLNKLTCLTGTWINSPITVVILDNETTGMTGGQESSAHGKLEGIVLGLGVPPDHLHVLEPLKRHHARNVEIITEELQHPGVSVIIQRRECIQTAGTTKKGAKSHEA